MDNSQDALLSEYLLSEGAARPEEEAMRRRAERMARLRSVAPLGAGMQMEGTRTAPGHFVATSPLQALANIGEQFGQKYQMDKSDAEQLKYGEAKQARMRAMLEKYRTPRVPQASGNWVGEPYQGGFGDER
jgi:hypothetical protein